MAVKRKREHEEAETMERLREEQDSIATAADKPTYLPEPLQLQILSSVETKVAIQTLALCKSSVSAWTCIPVLNFSYHSFRKLRSFDKFVYNALCFRGPAKLEKLTFKRGGTSCSAKILRKVFCYAFSNGVKELEVDISHGRKHGEWPTWMHVSSDSLTSFKLENSGCPLCAPRPGSFKNLTSLHLESVIIKDLDPFSGYPALEKLKLVGCRLNTNGKVLNVHALHLSEFTISKNDEHVNLCELTTPKLRYFEYHGESFPRLMGDLPILDTAVVEYNGSCRPNHRKIMFDDMLMLFDKLCHAKSLTVFSSFVLLLSFFPDELVNRRSPFRDLKYLKLDFGLLLNAQHLFECIGSESMNLLPSVKAYLLQNLHDARCTIRHDSQVYVKRGNPKLISS